MGKRHYLSLGSREDVEAGIWRLASDIRTAASEAVPLSIKFREDFIVPGYSGPDVEAGKNFASFRYFPKKKGRRDHLRIEPSAAAGTFDNYFAVFGPESEFVLPGEDPFSPEILAGIYENSLEDDRGRVHSEGHGGSRGRTFYLAPCEECPFERKPELVGSLFVGKSILSGGDLLVSAEFDSEPGIFRNHNCKASGGKYDYSSIIARLAYGFAEAISAEQRARAGIC